MSPTVVFGAHGRFPHVFLMALLVDRRDVRRLQHIEHDIHRVIDAPDERPAITLLQGRIYAQRAASSAPQLTFLAPRLRDVKILWGLRFEQCRDASQKVAVLLEGIWENSY